MYVPAFLRVEGPIGTPRYMRRSDTRGERSETRARLFISSRPLGSLPGAEERGETYVNTASPCFTVAAYRSSDPFYKGDTIDDVTPTATPPYSCKHTLGER